MAQSWRYTPTMILMERYTDNVFLVEKKPKGDAVTTGILGLAIAYQGKAMKLGADYRAIAERYSRYSELDNVGHSASVDLGLDHIPGSRTTSLSLTDTVRFLPEQPDFGGVAAQAGALDGPAPLSAPVQREDSLTNTGTLALTHQSSPSHSERIRYTNRLTRFKNSALLDSNTHEGGLDIISQLDADDSMTIAYSYRYFDYKKTEDSQNHGFTVGWDHLFSASLSMTANVGLNYSIQSTDRSTGVIGKFNLSKSYKRVRWNVGYTKDVSLLGGGLSAEPVTTQTASASLAYTLTQNINATITGRITDNRSLRGDVVDILSWTAGTALTYQIRSWLSSGIRYNHLDQRVRAVVGNDLSRNQYIFDLTATLP